ncbi:MAG: nucleotide exchange factor GrpE [Dehalococcoidia bacterium]|nr:nucleotide exchange factor GrpE [Dehalococcoidia bacterium]
MVMSEPEDDAEELPAEGGEEDILAGDEADDLQARLEEAEREREQFKSMAARAQADLVNYRRRAEEEKEEIQRSAKSALLMKMLSTVDDLDRAIAMIPTDESAGWAEGIQLVRRNVVNMLDTEGVTKVESMGEPYDPAYAEALLFRETEDGEEGTVVEVFREGYMYKDRVLRAAQVVVAKRPEQPETDDSNETNSDKETA